MGFCEGSFEEENECGEIVGLGKVGLFPDFGKLTETNQNAMIDNPRFNAGA
jgi:hypothetical protein